MRTIGLLGGMSWESSAEYYRVINETVRDRLGGLHSAKCILYSVDFATIERLQASGDWEAAGQQLAAAGRALEAAGAEVILLCTNTMHIVAEQIEQAIKVPFLHLADATAQAVRRAGIAKVGLLGTAFTMERPFYRDRLEQHGLAVLTPAEQGRAQVHRIIYQELCLGIINDDSRRIYQQVIADLVDAGAEGVILGCTEIELLIKPQDSPIPVFPTSRIHAQAAVDLALADG